MPDPPDGTLIATWVLVVLAFASIFYQVRETTRSRRAQAFATFRDYWESRTTRTRRRRLASALLDGMTVDTIPEAVIEDLVNFFEDLGTAFRQGYLSPFDVWSLFHEDAIHYWSAIGEAYARECRENAESQEYAEFEWMVNELNKFERRKTGRIPVLNAEDVREYLNLESQLDQPITLTSGKRI